VTPRLVAAFLIITLSSIGLPGLNGFVGEFLILLGAFRWDPKLAAFAATGVILSATYMLWMFQRVNYGPVTNEKNASLPDLQPREWAVIVPIVAMTVLMGVLPNLFLRPIGPSVERTLTRIHQGSPARVRKGAATGDLELVSSNPHSRIPNPRSER
jgi:NADH-quinone oxidoreductase subunit M